MITDRLTSFLTATALNATAVGNFALGETVDIQNLRDIGQGTPLYLVISVAETVTGGGTSAVSFSLASDAEDPLDPAGATTHLTTQVFDVADLNAGTTIMTVMIPWEGPQYERYVGIIQHTTGAALTAGSVNAFLTPTPQSKRIYAEYA